MVTESAQLTCLQQLSSLEQNGTKQTLPCGETSGSPGCALHPCQDNLAALAAQRSVVNELNKQITAANAADDHAEAEIQTQVSKRDETLAASLAVIDAAHSTDYVARVSALGELTAAHPEILAVEIFIVLLFIFVDIIPITMKLLTPISEYDAIRHTLLQDRMVREQIKQEVIHSDAHRDALRAAAADAFATMGEADIIAHQSEAITRRYIDHKIEFERVFRTLSGNDTRVAGQVAAITEIEDTDGERCSDTCGDATAVRSRS